MTKAILVLDEMPKSCEDCELCRDGYLCLRLGEVDESIVNGTKDLRCPLKPMPEKKDEHIKFDSSDLWGVARIINVENKGYNNCIEEILGEEE